MIDKEQEVETIHPETVKDWRQWLKKNHSKKQSVWLIYYKMKSGKPRISWSDAVDEALCFGWIDSKAKPINEDTYMQFFSKRKANSAWSKVNKEKIQRLISEGRMAKAGLESIEIAKQNGSWTILDEVEAFTIPDDLEEAFKVNPGSKDSFLELTKYARKTMLYRLVLAKRDETRQKRIGEIVALAGKGDKPR